MKKVIIFLIGFLILSLSIKLFEQKSPSNNDEYTIFIEHLMDQYQIPGLATSIVEDGQITYENTFGFADLEQTVPFTDETLFRTESISKSLTAYGILYLVDQGHLSLDDKVSTYIDIEPLDDNTTIRQLLTHKAGLNIGSIGKHYSPNDELIPSAYENIRDEIDYIFEVDTRFFYSNVGYNIIELIIEEVSGISFAEYMREVVLEYFYMPNASFQYDVEARDLYATGYELDGDPVPMYVYPEKSSGGLYADLHDMTNFLLHTSMNQSLLTNTTFQDMQSVQTEIQSVYSLISQGYSYGHFIDNNYIFHGGQGHGWMAFYVINPDTEDGIFIVANSQRAYPVFSSIIEEWTKDKEPMNFSMISGLRPFILGMVISLYVVLAILYVKSIYNIRSYSFIQHKEISLSWYLKIILLIGLIGVLFYLILSSYVFINVLYPIIMFWVTWLIGLYCIYLLTSILFVKDMRKS